MDFQNQQRAYDFRKDGFTLIELLVALAIGSIIIGLAIGFFKTAIAQNTSVSYSAQIQEESFFASHVVKQQMAQIGYRPIDLTKIDGRASPLTGANTAFPEVTGSRQAGQTFKIDATALMYRYYGASTDTLEADGSIYDCHGNSIADGELQENKIDFVNEQLRCVTDTETSVIMGDEDNIAVFGLTYEVGIDDDGDNVIDRTISSTLLENEDYSNAMNLKMRLLLASPDGVTSDKLDYYFMNVERNGYDRRLRVESEIAMAIRN